MQEIVQLLLLSGNSGVSDSSRGFLAFESPVRLRIMSQSSRWQVRCMLTSRPQAMWSAIETSRRTTHYQGCCLSFDVELQRYSQVQYSAESGSP